MPLPVFGGSTSLMYGPHSGAVFVWRNVPFGVIYIDISGARRNYRGFLDSFWFSHGRCGMGIKIYLAGPDVFLAKALQVGRLKVELCREKGFEGLFPLDQDEASGGGDAAGIFLANRDLMRAADIGLFNLTPFRGPSADAGTVFELGFMHALGKPVYGYSAASADYSARAASTHGPLAVRNDRRWDRDGYAVEDFGLVDNLMIDRAIREAEGAVCVAEEDPEAPVIVGDIEVGLELRDPLAAFRAFAECLDAVERSRSLGGVVRSGT